MKQAIIFDHGGGELANQLWNYASLYAWCLEEGYTLENPSFFEYGYYFSLLQPSNIFFKYAFFLPFKNDRRRKQSFKKKLWRFLYKFHIVFIRMFKQKNIISSLTTKNEPVYLDQSLEQQEKVYFEGWLFRNPTGLLKYRSKIQNYFLPKQEIQDTVQETLGDIRKNDTHVVGVHIRQGDYRTWKGGAYFIPQKRVREIINEYLTQFRKNPSTTHFLITSDGPVHRELFDGINYSVSTHDMVTDLFSLSGCDVVIGSDSSFGDFAAYYGNIPHIIFKKEAIDWKYYKDKKSFFENKYCTMVHY